MQYLDSAQPSIVQPIDMTGSPSPASFESRSRASKTRASTRSASTRAGGSIVVSLVIVDTPAPDARIRVGIGKIELLPGD